MFTQNTDLCLSSIKFSLLPVVTGPAFISLPFSELNYLLSRSLSKAWQTVSITICWLSKWTTQFDAVLCLEVQFCNQNFIEPYVGHLLVLWLQVNPTLSVRLICNTVEVSVMMEIFWICIVQNGNHYILGYWAHGMWLVWLRDWILSFTYLKLIFI